MTLGEDEEKDLKKMTILVVEVSTAQRARIVHLRNRMLAHSSSEIFLFPLRPSSEIHLKNLTDEGERIVRTLAEIEGTTEVDVGLYLITIHFGLSFKWDGEIADKTLNVLKRHLEDDSLTFGPAAD